MSQNFTLVFNSKHFILPPQFKMLELISTNIKQALTSNDCKYQIQSKISDEVFQQFYQYLIDGTDPEINSDTIHDLERISQEFQIQDLLFKIEKELNKIDDNKYHGHFFDLVYSYGEIPSSGKNCIELMIDRKNIYYVRKRIEDSSQQSEYNFIREVSCLTKAQRGYPFVSLVKFEYPTEKDKGYMRQINIKNNNNEINDFTSVDNLPHSAFSNDSIPFNKIDLNNTRKMIIIYGTAKAISFLHYQRPPILHCDIRPENILLDANGEPYLSGFGLAREISQRQKINDVIEEVSYTAPEIIINEYADISADIYSFGVTMIMIFAEKLTITKNNRKLDFTQFLKKQKISLKLNKVEFDIPKDIPIQLKELISKCIDVDHSSRPNINEILSILESEQVISMFDIQYKEYISKFHIDDHKDSSSKLKSNDIQTNNSNNIPKYNQIIFEPKWMKDLKKLKVVSQEYFYDVFEVNVKDTNNIFLAKVFYVFMDYYSFKSRKKIRKSLKNILKINHPSILRSLFFSKHGFGQEKRPTLITEYNTNLSLNDIIINGPGTNQWNATKKLICIYGIASGMSYLHSQKIYHLNLNPENIIIDANFYPKIKDFGLVGIFKSLKTFAKIIDFSQYLAPEIYLNSEYNERSEVYSYSMIIYAILNNKLPFEKVSSIDILKNIENDIKPPFNPEIPEEYQDLIKRCWSIDPKNRPSFSQIVKELEKKEDLLQKKFLLKNFKTTSK